MPKYLGQHFLIDKNKLQEIVEALDLKPNEVVIEIGPGHGELTNELKVKSLKLKVVAIEKDKKFVHLLRKKFALDKNIEIIEGDALKVLPNLTNNLQLTTNNYKITGNIPYYITGYLLRILGELENKPSLIVLTVQKEVAERIIALRQAQGELLRPFNKFRVVPSKVEGRQVQGKPHMNLLAASVQFWAKPEIIGFIPKKYFRPIPKVDGAIIKLTTDYRLRTTDPKIQKNYYKLIRIIFKQPRKTILNNLLATSDNRQETKAKIIKKLQKLNINPQDRPQDLTIEQLLELSTLF